MSKFKKSQLEPELEEFGEPMGEDNVISRTHKPGPLNPSAHSSATGPEDEENMYGNDVDGPNLGADLSNDLLEPDPVDDEYEATTAEISLDEFVKRSPRK
jgi:hypothetical protein